MKKIKELFVKYREFITYVIFGVMTTVVNLVAFTGFNSILGPESYLISNVIAWIFAVLFAYITNKLFVFNSKSWRADVLLKEIISFVAARVFSLLIEEAGLFLLVDALNFKELSLNLFGLSVGGNMIAKLILALIVVLLNYVFSKLYIFKKKA